VVSVQSNNWY